jgi:hypothetical protein
MARDVHTCFSHVRNTGESKTCRKLRADDVACRYANLLELKRKTEGRNGMFLTLEDSLRKWYLPLQFVVIE